MAEDRSLDEFLGADEPSDPDATEEPGAPDSPSEPPAANTESDGGPNPPTEAEVEPMAEALAWSPAGGECADCGERVEERWRDDGGLVCGDCKAW